MGGPKTSDFSDKHPGRQPDGGIAAEIRRRIQNDELPCAKAFDIAKALAVPAADVGMTADLLKIRLVKCQLGLFGYSPAKKIVRAAGSVDPALETALRGSLENGRLPCRTAWQLAERFGMRKMAGSSACEALGVKIRPCQLGAF